MDPYQIWGDGEEERDFTYVENIVEGSILASEKLSDCTPLNLGTGNRYKIIDVVNMIFNTLKWTPLKFDFDISMPVEALSRALDNSRAEELLGWKARFSLAEGLLQLTGILKLTKSKERWVERY